MCACWASAACATTWPWARTCAATAAGDTAAIRGFTFTADAAKNTGTFFAVGASDAATCENLIAAINQALGETSPV